MQIENNKSEPRRWAKIVFLSIFGSFLDFFDFSIFALFASYITQVFFTHDSHLLGLMKSFAVFAVGYLARPLGGFLFGWWGDRKGRKTAFVYSILTMSFSTLFIALLPGYELLGGWAPLFLLFFRFIQGISFGGELPGAVVFTAEHLSSQRGFAASLIIASLNVGSAFAGFAGWILTESLSSSQMAAWGWRVPFFFGFLIGIVGFWVRKSTVETPIFRALEQKGVEKHPFFYLLKTDFPSFLIGVSLTALSASAISWMIFLPTYFSLFLPTSTGNSYFLTASLFLILAIGTPLFGYFSDRTGRKIWLFLSSFLVPASSFFLLKSGTVWLWLFFPFFSALNVGCYEIAIAELFRPNVRCSGLGVCHNLGYALFGGIAPLIYVFLFQMTGDPASPFYFLSFASLVTFVGSFFIKNRF